MVIEKVRCPHHKCDGGGWRLWSVMGDDDCEDLREDWCSCPAGVAGRAAQHAEPADAWCDLDDAVQPCHECGCTLRTVPEVSGGVSACQGCGMV